jgi:hypothetical protein
MPRAGKALPLSPHRLILINVPDRITTDSPVMATETLDKLQRLRFIHLSPFRYIEAGLDNLTYCTTEWSVYPSTMRLERNSGAASFSEKGTMG